VVIFFIIYYFFFSPTSQLFGKVIYHVKTDKKLIALTFDDGPNEPYTSQILNLLKKYNIKATFFPVGENVARHRKTIQRMAREGHIIGNHTYSHSLFNEIFPINFNKSITKTQNLIHKVTGKTPILFRPPWFLRSHSIFKSAKKNNLTTITGTFGSYREVFQPNGKLLAKDAIKKIKPGAILVFHDGYNNKSGKRISTVEAIKEIIPIIISKGYKFVTLPELLSVESQEKQIK
jgi:peptidoglycan/xylan/chitin deacetylase (PgdA/CDA1 family)